MKGANGIPEIRKQFTAAVERAAQDAAERSCCKPA